MTLFTAAKKSCSGMTSLTEIYPPLKNRGQKFSGYIDKENKPFKETGVKGAGSSLANAEDFMGRAGSSRSRFKLSISPV